jgi:hypothetical protein
MSRYQRQTDLVKCDPRTPIVVIGAGGIGSFTALTLAKMGMEDITVYDFDDVEEHNLPNQFYRTSDIGERKVDALYTQVMQFTGTHINTFEERFTADKLQKHAPTVVIAAVDSMAARGEVFQGFMNSRTCRWLIDGRMGGDQAEVYTIQNTAEDCAWYKERLWKDEDTAPVPCTSRATMYNVLTIASMIANNTRLALMGEPVHRGLAMDNRNVVLHHIA